MPQSTETDTPTRLLNAAADLVAADPGGEFSLRDVCDAAGVKLPTLYHFFGSKQGLIEAIVERGFDMYLAEKTAAEPADDPIQAIREGWDAHVAFGLRNPGFYTLMYGKVQPGYSPPAQARPSVLLRRLAARAHDQGRLVVGVEQAAAHILVANVGVTLRQIVLAREDRALSAAVREGVIAAITGAGRHGDPAASAHGLAEFAAANPEILGVAETRLFIEWAGRLGAAGAADPTPLSSSLDR